MILNGPVIQMINDPLLAHIFILDLILYRGTLKSNMLSLDLMLSQNIGSWLTAHTNHIEVNIHFTSHKVISKNLLIQHVTSTTQVVDTLTKPFDTAAFHELHDLHAPLTLRSWESIRA